MTTYARDITITLVIKLFFLFLLWWVCVRGMHPVLSSSKEWLLGKDTQPIISAPLSHFPEV